MNVTDDTFDAEVRRSSIPVLVEFWATWCPPCRRMVPVLDSVAQAYEGRLKVAKVDTDTNPGITREAGVLANPTLSVYRDGEVVFSVVGARSLSRLTTELETALS
ncbi:thioredoxin family protein [Fodinicola feengrottensis]|uniref:thioredoxin family protein n=1 Tax=Fodinicola feengrottensis TaxID=435914 RepID=UPI002441B59B|nr:thioredoxin domain-containing protein [Fodinicola feengrottensis]